MKYPNSANYLFDLRQAAKLTQSQVARKLKFHGQFISNLERGEAYLPPKYLSRFNKLIPAFDPSHYVNLVVKDKARLFFDRFVKAAR